jgi:uncharacterized protein (TIGR02996 family)
MSTIRDTFLADIRKDPDDDAPRLVFADWLEDEGDPARAEFIRVQCALAHLEEDDPRRDDLGRRELELLAVHSCRWTEGAFLEWLDHDEADCPIEQPHGLCELFAKATRLRIQSHDPALGARDQVRCLDDLEQLKQQCEAFNYRGYELGMSFFEQFEFERGFIHKAVVEEVLLFTFAPALHDLTMVRDLFILYDDTDPRIGAEVLRMLVEHVNGPPLVALRVGTTMAGGTSNDVESLEELAAWAGLAQLRQLHLAIWNIDADLLVETLAASPHLGQVDDLEFYLDNEYTDAAVEAILDSPHLMSLKKVRLIHDDQVGEISAEVLARFRARFGVAHPDDR